MGLVEVEAMEAKAGMASTMGPGLKEVSHMVVLTYLASLAVVVVMTRWLLLQLVVALLVCPPFLLVRSFDTSSRIMNYQTIIKLYEI
jgi:uncharacterized membrane protein YjgN (DUF898 family)